MANSERRLQASIDESRRYPAPIARCDDELTALLDERRRLMDELTQTNHRGGCSPAATWINDGGFDAA